MIGNSATVTPLFLETQPDWQRPVQVVTSYRTSIAETRNEGRQRARWRAKPRYSIAYALVALNVAEASLRRSKLIGELAAPLVVPIWTDQFTLSAMTSTHVANLGVTLAKKRFKVGSYAYFVQSGKTSTFRKITVISGTSLTFEAATVPVFTAGATVYPCIVGARPKSSAAFTFQRIDQTDEAIIVEEI